MWPSVHRFMVYPLPERTGARITYVLVTMSNYDISNSCIDGNNQMFINSSLLSNCYGAVEAAMFVKHLSLHIYRSCN